MCCDFWNASKPVWKYASLILENVLNIALMAVLWVVGVKPTFKDTIFLNGKNNSYCMEAPGWFSLILIKGIYMPMNWITVCINM